MIRTPRRLIAASVAIEQVQELERQGVRDFPLLYLESGRADFCDLSCTRSAAPRQAASRSMSSCRHEGHGGGPSELHGVLKDAASPATRALDRRTRHGRLRFRLASLLWTRPSGANVSSV